VRRCLAIVLLTSAVGAAAAAQPPSKIDFKRDVQPIFRQRCHGAEQEMNGLRLDRRADAMRGGTQSDIGQGNADGSRLYQRLVGTNFGLQIPPSRPLAPEEIDTIKQWIDEGAEWPDDVSGEPAVIATTKCAKCAESVGAGGRCLAVRPMPSPV
jgi:Planctomycete cytochrome C